MIASLVGFGAVVASLPAFNVVRDAVINIPGGPLISLTVAMNTLAALTGTASGGSAIALAALGENYPATCRDLWRQSGPDAPDHSDQRRNARRAAPQRHRVALLQISKLTHAESYKDMVMTVIVGVIIALAAVLVLGSTFGSVLTPNPE